MYAIVTNVVKPASNSFLTDVLFDFNENILSSIDVIIFFQNKFIIQEVCLQYGIKFASYNI